VGSDWFDRARWRPSACRLFPKQGVLLPGVRMNPRAVGALEGFASPILGPMHTAPRIRASSPRRRPSFPVTVRPTKADIAVARIIARETGPVPGEVARALTWGADEKVLLVLAAAGWLASRGRGEPLRRSGNHALLVTIAASLLPHGMKILFDQTRPDRKTILGHAHGVSFSGKREDAFPSGHAPHMGALASAAGTLPAGPRRAIRMFAIGL